MWSTVAPAADYPTAAPGHVTRRQSYVEWTDIRDHPIIRSFIAVTLIAVTLTGCVCHPHALNKWRINPFMQAKLALWSYPLCPLLFYRYDKGWPTPLDRDLLHTPPDALPSVVLELQHDTRFRSNKPLENACHGAIFDAVKPVVNIPSKNAHLQASLDGIPRITISL